MERHERGVPDPSGPRTVAKKWTMLVISALSETTYFDSPG